MSIKDFSIEELANEIKRRKQKELPKLVEEVNKILDTIKALAGDIEYDSDPFKIDKIYINEEDGKVYYSDEEI